MDVAMILDALPLAVVFALLAFALGCLAFFITCGWDDDRPEDSGDA